MGDGSIAAAMCAATATCLRTCSSLILLCLWGAGCDLVGPSAGSPVAVEIRPTMLSLDLGEIVQMQAWVVDRGGRRVNDVSLRWYSSNASVATVSQGGLVRSTGAPGIVRIHVQAQETEGGVHDEARGWTDVSIGKVRFDNVEEHFIAEYERIFGFRISAPPITLDSIENDINTPRSPTKFKSAVYGAEELFVLELWPDGTVDGYSFEEPGFFFPRGEIKVGLVIVDSKNTNFAGLASTTWAAAVDSVNADLEHWAKSVGLPGPVVRFRTTTLMATRAEIPDPKWDGGVQAVAYLTEKGIEFDIAAMLNVDIHGDVQGWQRNRNVYLGCWPCTPAAGFYSLTPGDLHEMARMLYHHEIGHVFGWRHTLGGGPIGTRLVTHPALLGWTDTDGDGIVEILDPTPYGAAERPRRTRFD